MSVISEIFNSYKRALASSRDIYTSLYAERAENGRKFYEAFFNRLVIPFRQSFSNATSREYIGRQIERFFDTRQIDFVAIDGTCYKDLCLTKVPFNSRRLLFATQTDGLERFRGCVAARIG